MALIKCKECGVEVSSKAETCPNCGARVKAKPMGCGTFIGVVFIGGIIISIFSNIFSSDTGSGTLSPATGPSSKPSTPRVSTPAPKLPGSQWSYSQSDDAMGKGTINSAWVPSSNTVNFDFPYSGTQHATLMLRTHPRHGKDVIFYIEKGQILCHTYENCTVLVRFDDESPLYYTAAGAADNSTETIFIHNYNKFIEKMLTSKQVRISANIYQQGAPAFEFDVSNFDQAKYKKTK
jgi:hypothetical protein